MAKRYRVTLTDEERERLERLTRTGTASARMVRRAQTLLLAAEDRRDEEIAKALRIGVANLAHRGIPGMGRTRAGLQAVGGDSVAARHLL